MSVYTLRHDVRKTHTIHDHAANILSNNSSKDDESINDVFTNIVQMIGSVHVPQLAAENNDAINFSIQHAVRGEATKYK